MVDALARHTGERRIAYFGVGDPRRGIVHVIGPEQGLTQPGILLVCGDSHTATHGAFGALAFGIGSTRGRARARHAVPVAAEAEDDAHHRRRPRSGPASARRT